MERRHSFDKRYPAAAFFLAAVLLGFWLWASGLSRSDLKGETFTITAFSVGKADALLLQEQDTAILLDTGEEDDGVYLLEELKKRGITHLDVLLITHFDKDHVGSAALVMENLSVDTVLIPDYEGDRPEYLAFMESLEGHSDVQTVTEPMEYTTGALDWMIYPAEEPEEILNTEDEYDNDMSLVAKVTYGTCRFLLTGDIEKTRIAQMLAADVDWQCDWIKMPHHGRYQKALNRLLDAAQPSSAVICCSEKNPAEQKTLDMLKERGISVWDTSQQSVVTVSDGEKIAVRYD